MLEKIASEMAPRLVGVDWVVLEEKFGMHRNELVYHSDTSKPPDETGAFAYDRYIQKALVRAEEQLKQIQLTFQVKDDPNTQQDELVLAMSAWDEVQQESIKMGDVILNALGAGKSFFGSNENFVVQREAYRAAVSATYLICLYGALVHMRKLMQFEEIPGEVIVQSADNLAKTLNGLAILGEIGALDALKPEAPPATGTPISAVITISIASVFAVGVICFMLVTMQQQVGFNRNVRLVCEDAVKRQDKSMLDRCQALLEMNTIAINGGPPFVETAKSIGNAALKIAVLVGAFYLVSKAWKYREESFS